MEAGNFRFHLQKELVERCGKNRHYSLRAFARHLELDPSVLSRILRGQRKVTPNLMHRLGQHLELTPSQLKKYSGEKAQSDYTQISEDSFQALSQWYYFAILEMTHLDHFKSDPKWIARSLGISVSEARIAWETLQRMGLLTNESGKWVDCSERATTLECGQGYTSVALKKLQRQILQKAAEAMDSIPLELRNQTSITTVGNSQLVEEAKNKIKEFRRELAGFLKSRRPFDSVFNIGISLYPVTKPSRVSKEKS